MEDFSWRNEENNFGSEVEEEIEREFRERSVKLKEFEKFWEFERDSEEDFEWEFDRTE